MIPWRLVTGALLVILAVVYVVNCVKNVTVKARVVKICPAIIASTTERFETFRPFLSRLFEADAPRFQQMPDLIVGQTCARLETELVWYRWNLFRRVRLDDTLRQRTELIGIIDRATPGCVERMTRGIEDRDSFDSQLAAASCPMLKTIRAVLDLRAEDASPWVMAGQLERLVPNGAKVAEGREP